ncbi:unnamed protein product [Prunus armeniaca]
MSGTPTILHLIADSQKHVVTPAYPATRTPASIITTKVDRILKYLKSAPGKRLTFSKNGDLEVVGYIDADWAGSITDRRSTSGYFTFVGDN